MNKEQKGVLEFHREFDLTINDVPTWPSDSDQVLCVRLIQEELDEMYEGIEAQDMSKVADGLGDLLYVVYGAAIRFGIDLEPVFEEVQRSNMTKVGGHKREDGKWVKPDTYSPPDIASVLIKLGYEE